MTCGLNVNFILFPAYMWVLLTTAFGILTLSSPRSARYHISNSVVTEISIDAVLTCFPPGGLVPLHPHRLGVTSPWRNSLKAQSACATMHGHEMGRSENSASGRTVGILLTGREGAEPGSFFGVTADARPGA